MSPSNQVPEGCQQGEADKSVRTLGRKGPGLVCTPVSLATQEARMQSQAPSHCWAVLAHSFNPSTWEAEAGGLLQL